MEIAFRVAIISVFVILMSACSTNSTGVVNSVIKKFDLSKTHNTVGDIY